MEYENYGYSIYTYSSFVGDNILFVRTTKRRDFQKLWCSVEYYQTYMTAGNKYKRKPFERITIKFDDANYARHFRFDESLVRKNKGDHVCFEFYDRKLNSHIKDSKIIKWLD